jgi:Holliday junction resolvase
MPLKNAKAKGSRNERRSMALLEAAGYVCTKAGGSLGAWDVIGIGTNDFVLVQVKSNAWPGSVEMETLQLFRVPKNCKKLVHRWRDMKRAPDVREV